MKKLIPLLLAMALMLVVWSFFGPVHAQDPANEEKPTFYRLIPGVYVNGWPRFTITYPRDWVEVTPMPQEVFRASAPGPSHFPETFDVALASGPLRFYKLTDLLMLFFKTIATNVTVVSDKPSQLRDGTPAQEVEIQMVINGETVHWFALGAKWGDLLINAGVGAGKGNIGEDLKAIVYSLQFQPGKDEPVKVSPDVQEFLDKHNNDVLSHDIAKVMANYSDRFLKSGTRKGEVERMWRQMIGYWTSVQGVITDFVPAGDRAYLAGFVITNLGTFPIFETSIIKENGEWKWYGNQRDISP